MVFADFFQSSPTFFPVKTSLIVGCVFRSSRRRRPGKYLPPPFVVARRSAAKVFRSVPRACFFFHPTRAPSSNTFDALPRSHGSRAVNEAGGSMGHGSHQRKCREPATRLLFRWTGDQPDARI
ncbi:hypothetical protein GQ55_6G142800 [Panicum hallii var. hallii]|uniref:Uncharacterized protein n=1 Tax=Panicum hallii var. hallii TaxID=1504633 RepID=A0A2T7D667_9POAL|nr:hypothetical protein GQ55_6G142800 [Panicum hallii var. hallii]